MGGDFVCCNVSNIPELRAYLGFADRATAFNAKVAFLTAPILEVAHRFKEETRIEVKICVRATDYFFKRANRR